MSTQPDVTTWPARDGEVIDSTWDENSGPPEHRIEVIAARARDAQQIAAARQQRKAS